MLKYWLGKAWVSCFVFTLLICPAFAATYELDPEYSFVSFSVSRNEMSRLQGRFNSIHGTVNFNEKDPAKSKVEIVIKATSIDTNNEKRDNHLRGPDFLNVKQFPLITFKSLLVTPLRYHQYRVTGQLALHGVTKPITIIFNKSGEITDRFGITRVAGNAVLIIKRNDFQMGYLLGPIGNEVKLVFNIEGIKKTAFWP